MLIEWAVISAAVAPHIKKYAAEKAEKLAKDYADSKLSQLYKRIVPDQKLVKATESFVIAFDKELYLAADVPTFTIPAYQEALKTFLADPDVLETLEAPLDGESKLDCDLLNRKWTYLHGIDDKPLIALPDDFDWAGLANRYCKSLQKQALADPELRQIVQAKAALRTAQAIEVLARPIKAFDLARYAQSIKESFCYLRLGSLDADWTAYENRVHLENIYVPQSAKQALPPRDLTRDYLRELKEHGAQVRGEDRCEQKEGYAELRAVPILEVVDDPAYSRFVVLGDPGLGKSTLLKYLALRWAHEPRRPLALLIELRRSISESGEIDFLGYLERGPGQTLPLPRLQLDAQLKDAESLVMFDAIDEVTEGRRGDVVLQIISFAREYPKARIIVTTRIHGYHPGSSHPEQFRDAQFQQFTLQDFDRPGIDRFVSTWHKEAFRDLAERSKYEARLRKALADSPAISELAANPLLLTMMAILNRVQDLPRDRGRLYERCAELLLKNWDLEKFPELMERKQTRDIKDKLGPEQKMRILELVAAAMQQERTGLAGNIIGEAKLKAIIQKQLSELGISEAWAVADDLIALLRERNFMLAYLGDHQFAFVHRTFLEYFCARDLKYRLEKTSNFTVDDLAAIFRARWPQDEWQEVLCLLCGLIGPEHAAKFIAELLAQRTTAGGDKAVFLAARCLQEIRELVSIRDVRESARQALLALAGFDRRYVYLQREYQGDLEDTRIRQDVVTHLARGWKEEDWVVGWLKGSAEQDLDVSVREVAVEELVRGWKEERWLAEWLKERALKDPGRYVRLKAVEELARGWKEEGWVAEWVKERAQQDRDPYVRVTAVRELAQGWKEEGWVAGWLKDFSLADPEINVRWVALEELARGWKKEGWVAEWLKQQALQDPATFVRYAALQELARGWKKEDWVAGWLMERAMRDSDAEVREMAKRELARGWGEDPEVKAFLEKRKAAQNR